MSHSAGADIRWTPEKRQSVALIEALLRYGWSIDDHGAISYLPAGDDGTFDWQRAALDQWPQVRGVLAAKAQAEELIGVSLTWADSGTGGDFLFAATGDEVLVRWTINRRTIGNGFGATDHNWYLEKLLPALSGAGVALEVVTCSDSWIG